MFSNDFHGFLPLILAFERSRCVHAHPAVWRAEHPELEFLLCLHFHMVKVVCQEVQIALIQCENTKPIHRKRWADLVDAQNKLMWVCVCSIFRAHFYFRCVEFKMLITFIMAIGINMFGWIIFDKILRVCLRSCVKFATKIKCVLKLAVFCFFFFTQNRFWSVWNFANRPLESCWIQTYISMGLRVRYRQIKSKWFLRFWFDFIIPMQRGKKRVKWRSLRIERNVYFQLEWIDRRKKMELKK